MDISQLGHSIEESMTFEQVHLLSLTYFPGKTDSHADSVRVFFMVAIWPGRYIIHSRALFLINYAVMSALEPQGGKLSRADDHRSAVSSHDWPSATLANSRHVLARCPHKSSALAAIICPRLNGLLSILNNEFIGRHQSLNT